MSDTETELENATQDAQEYTAKTKRISTKKFLGWLFLLNGLGMCWLSFFKENPNDLIGIISLVLGTGITLLGIKTMGNIAGAKK